MISCENLVRIYKTAEFEVIALQGLDLEVADGELMAIIGNSGSGKSTLLNIIGGLDLGRFYPELKDCLLVCVTEQNSRPEIDALAKALGGGR